ncbi:glycosyltransferase family 4 protein [Empedobacter tilapiae]|uniref:Glycosyltransferase family 4 protein n=1 Tax=Empedobacter tilapiae TaxID=2491114 RepID=A0A4Z1B7F1_9FLAO|nr:glycosyltransferase family 4 protein [Empedobacter tilapiae]TGN27166.1 glycosyltransferase family 4 protein [Empedobacter tilapiae]
MKIAYFFPNLKDSAGTERMLNVKANYLADVLHHEVTIITYSQFEDPIFFEFSEKIRFVHFNIPDPTSKLKGLGYWEKRKQYKEFMTTYRQKVEEYFYNNLTDIAISMYFGAEHKFLPLIKDGSKKIMEYHFHFDITPLSKKLKEKWSVKNLKMKIQTYLFQKTLNKYDKIIVLTEQDQEEWGRYFSNIINIPNPITINPIKANTELEKVLAVGRFTYQKGFNYLIDAWAIVNKDFPNWQLDIYGSGELEEELKLQVKELNLENSVNIFKPRKDINQVFSEHSIFALSSRFEGFPLVLIEALSCGLAPVAFECKNGPKQMMGDSQLNDFLVTPFDVDNFAESLKTLISNKELRLQMSEEAIKVSKKYELENIMSIWESTFLKLLNK